MSELSKVLDAVGKDKGIDRKVLITAIEEALATACKRKWGLAREIEVRYNDDSGEVEVFQFMKVVSKITDRDREITLEQAKEYDEEVALDDSIGIKIDSSIITRIAAQTAKQVIVQKVREAEREIIFNEFQHMKGDIITGLIRRVDRGAVIIDLGRTEGFMPLKEQIPGENYTPGDRLQAFLTDVQLTPKGPRIILSRAAPEYLIALFQNEVPEIREGLVSIHGAAREPGIRAKIAVSSRDSDVDPIGACVGVRGSRVQAIVQELKGERIDIVPYDEDITRFVCNALSPAEIQKVIIDDENKSIEVVVGDDNLSLAIGRRGQNVRLASQLTHWKLDITSETVMARKLTDAKRQLMMIDGVTETLAMALYQAGFDSARDVSAADPEMFADIPGFDVAKGADVIQKAKATMATGEVEKIENEIRDRDFKEKQEKAAARAAAAGMAKAGEGMPKGADGSSGDFASLDAKLKAELEKASQEQKD